MRRSRPESGGIRRVADEDRPTVSEPPGERLKVGLPAQRCRPIATAARTRPLVAEAAPPPNRRRHPGRRCERAGTALSRCVQRGGEESLRRERGGDRGRAECDRSSRGCERAPDSQRRGERGGAERLGREPGRGEWRRGGLDPPLETRHRSGKRVGSGGGATIPHRVQGRGAHTLPVAV